MHLQEIQQYKDLIAKLKKQKYLSYQNIYQQGYSRGHTSRRYWKQYKPLDVLQMCTPCYHPAPMDPFSPSSAE